MRENVPLATAPVEIEKRIEDFPHVDLPPASSAWALLGRRDQRFHDGPWLIREIRRICLSKTIFLSHMRTLLCCRKMR
jgi:hypothetical protein